MGVCIFDVREIFRAASICAVLMYSSERESRVYLPEGRECNLIEEMVCVLKPFVQATTFMSGSTYPTVGTMSPLLYKLLHNTLAMKEDNSRAVKSINEPFLMI